MAKTWVKGGGGGGKDETEEKDKDKDKEGVADARITTTVVETTISAPPLARTADLHLRPTQPHSWYSRSEARRIGTEGLEAPREVHTSGKGWRS